MKLAVALFLGVKQENLMFRLGRIKLIDEFLEGLLGLAVDPCYSLSLKGRWVFQAYRWLRPDRRKYIRGICPNGQDENKN
jgi:hypothetical protein